MRTSFLLAASLLLCGLFTSQLAQAQLYFSSGGCPGKLAQVEIINNSPCDYEFCVYYSYGGTVLFDCGIVGAGKSLVVCYDHVTSTIVDLDVTELGSGTGQSFSPPGFPGFQVDPFYTMCGAGFSLIWDNDVSTGPGHVTSWIIQ